jgi:hypothetical protein
MVVFRYAVKHKWYVFLECARAAFELRMPSLLWRGITHDIDKFRPSMLIAYEERFKNGIASGRDETGYYNPHKDSNEGFQRAFLTHIRRNDHHWQWWVEAIEEGEKVHAMSEVAVVEMVCDWCGAARANNQKPQPYVWFYRNKDKMRLHNKTIEAIVIELKRRCP